MTLLRAIRLSLSSVAILAVAFHSADSSAFIDNAKTPTCFSGSREIQVDNAQALDWKVNTENQFKSRAYVSGKLVGKIWTENSHYHWIIQIGSGEKDVLEIIYNKEFGSMPTDIAEGTEMSVCGDFINSFARGGGYDASPAGAIVHWIHYNPGDRGKSHEHGFVMIGDQLVGFDEAHESAWNGKVAGQDPVARPAPAPAPVRRPVAVPAPRPSKPAPVSAPAPIVNEPRDDASEELPIELEGRGDARKKPGYVHPMCKKKPWDKRCAKATPPAQGGEAA